MTTHYLLWCRECTPEPTADNALPFGSPAERGIWASDHTAGTGHERWLVKDWTVSEADDPGEAREALH